MTWYSNGFKVVTNGQSLVLTAVSRQGTARTVYTDQAGAVPVTLPYSFSTDTTFWVPVHGSYSLTFTQPGGTAVATLTALCTERVVQSLEPLPSLLKMAAELSGLDGSSTTSLSAYRLLPDASPSTASSGTLAVGRLARVDASGGAAARTLPSAASATAAGLTGVRKTDTGSNTITVSPAGSDTINGAAAARVLTPPEVVLTFVSDGVSNWTVASTDTPATQLSATYGLVVKASGDTTGATDTAAINAAITSAATFGVPQVRLAGDTFYVNAPIVLKSRVWLQGQGAGVTIIKLVAGANCDVLQGDGFSGLTMTGTAPFAGGVYNSVVSDLLIDGNRANQTGASYGYRVYGYANRVRNIIIRNAYTSGMWHEGGSLNAQDGVNDPGSECFFTDITIYNSGVHGFQLLGPSDCVVSNVTIGFPDAALAGVGIGFWAMSDKVSNVMGTNVSMNGTSASGFTGTFTVQAAQSGGATDLYPTAGTLAVTTSTGTATMTYTGKTATTFTGCAVTSGSGVFQTGNRVVWSGSQRFTINGLMLSQVHPFGCSQPWNFVLDGTVTATGCHSDGAAVGGVLIRGSVRWVGGEIYDFTPTTTGLGICLGDSGAISGVPLSHSTISTSACDIATLVVGLNLDYAGRAAVYWANAFQCNVKVKAVTQTTGTHTATIASGSNGVDVSTFTSGSPGTIFVTSTNQIPGTKGGTLTVPTAQGNVTVTYTGTNGTVTTTSRNPGTQFTGCVAQGTPAGGSTMSTGGTITQANIGSVGIGSTPDGGSQIDVHVSSSTTALSAGASMGKDFGQYRRDLGGATNGFMLSTNGVDLLGINASTKELHLPNGVRINGFSDNYITKQLVIDMALGLITGPTRGGKALTFPGAVQQPTDQGFVSWTFDPIFGTANSAIPTAGTMYGVVLHCPVAFTATNVHLYVLGAGNTLTAGQCFAMLYKADGTLVAKTADLSSGANSFAAGGAYTFALAGGPYANLPAGDYEVCFYFNGTTGPGLVRATNAATGLVNMNLAAASSRIFTADTGLTTTPPSTRATRVATAYAWWAGIS